MDGRMTLGISPIFLKFVILHLETSSFYQIVCAQLCRCGKIVLVPKIKWTRQGLRLKISTYNATFVSGYLCTSPSLVRRKKTITQFVHFFLVLVLFEMILLYFL